jgi:hypothetical protein
MFRRRNSTLTGTGARLSSRGRSRIYAFAAISLATFLVAMAVVRHPRLVTARADLLQLAGHIQNDDGTITVPDFDTRAEALLQRLKSVSFVDQLADHPQFSESANCQAGWCERVQQSLSAELRPGKSPREREIRVEYTATSEDEATQTLTAIIDQIMAERNTDAAAESLKKKWQQTRDAATEAGRRRQRARQALEAYLNREMERRRRDFAAQRPAEGSVGVAARSAEAGEPSALPKVEIPNIEWQSLEESLTEVEEKRAELLKTRTMAHPLVLRLDREIRNLKLALVDTPRFVVQENSHPEPISVDTRPGAADSTGAQAHAETAEFNEALARVQIEETEEYQQLDADSRLAQETYQLQLTRFQSLPAPDKLKFESLEISKPVHVGGQCAAMVSPLDLLNYAALAGLTGMALAVLRRFRRTPEVFYSRQDVADTLGLPVTAALSVEHGPPLPDPPDRTIPRVTRVAVAASEFVVAAVIVLILANCFIRSDYATGLLDDPFASYLDAIDQAKMFLLG